MKELEPVEKNSNFSQCAVVQSHASVSSLGSPTSLLNIAFGMKFQT